MVFNFVGYLADALFEQVFYAIYYLYVPTSYRDEKEKVENDNATTEFEDDDTTSWQDKQNFLLQNYMISGFSTCDKSTFIHVYH